MVWRNLAPLYASRPWLPSPLFYFRRFRSTPAFRSHDKDEISHEESILDVVESQEKRNKSSATRNRPVTPMIRQYLDIKQRYPGYLLLFRMGDFYEIFFEDAIRASQALDITLTKRGRHQGMDIPMCGIPFFALDNYLPRLIKRGILVAVCEQSTDPDVARSRGLKLVPRQVERLVTPGTIIEDRFLDPRSHNFLTSLFVESDSGTCSFCSLDLSTGQLFLQSSTIESLSSDLARLNPAEVLVPDSDIYNDSLLQHGVVGSFSHPESATRGPSSFSESKNTSFLLTRRSKSSFDVRDSRSEECIHRMWNSIRNASAGESEPSEKEMTTIDFYSLTPLEQSAMTALLLYVDETQNGRIPDLELRRTVPGITMSIDPFTRKSLELCATMSGRKEGSLLSTIDRTVTPGGARMLQTRLNAPLLDLDDIEKRHDEVEFFFQRKLLRDKIRSVLRRCADMERCIQRLSLKRGNARDMLAIGNTLLECKSLSELLSTYEESLEGIHHDSSVDRFPSLWPSDASVLLLEFSEKISRAIVSSPPATLSDGGYITGGFDAELDELLQLRDHGHSFLRRLQEKYRKTTNVTALRVKHNGILGFFIEVPMTHGQRMQQEFGELFRHTQTLSSVMRFKTSELVDIENRVFQAGNEARAREHTLFEQFCEELHGLSSHIRRIAQSLSSIDVACALAEVAADRAYVRPIMSSSCIFDVKGGRHPVVEQSREGRFVPNDCQLNTSNSVGTMKLITGPNMGGKSTYLRQNALICILAQLGSYVPAQHARIGIVDRVFSRVGASDDLSRDQSTFMVEMTETAHILRFATPNSFIIMDEIGRGTSTSDGVSIAWSILEFLLHEKKCRTLFSTHYHELSAICAHYPQIRPFTVEVIDAEKGSGILFTHRVVPGSADCSYGIHVAEIAGLPQSVIQRARCVMQHVEQERTRLDLSLLSKPDT